MSIIIRHELPGDFASALSNSEDYIIRGSTGIGTWARNPWIGFLNKNVSSTFKDGYYVAYIFKEDMSGFYLSLMFATLNVRTSAVCETTMKKAESIRDAIKSKFPQTEGYCPMNLGSSGRSRISSYYEKADIFNIGYDANDLPSDEQLIDDLDFVLSIYDYIFENDLVERNFNLIDEDILNIPSETFSGDKGQSDNLSKKGIFASNNPEKVLGYDIGNHIDNRNQNGLKNGIKEGSHSESKPSEYKKSVDKNGLDDEIKISTIESNPNSFYNFRQHTNRFEKLTDLLNYDNVTKLDMFELSQLQFDEIVSNISKTHKHVLENMISELNINFEELDILDKMLLFSKSFVKTHYKNGGGDFGYFMFNQIYIDDRQEKPYKITTIVHELSHFLLHEILEQILSEILDTDKTDVLEAFIFYITNSDEGFNLIDEYCASTVEGRYPPLGYQNYGSYRRILEDYHGDVSYLNKIGNTFAKYIKSIFESFIDEDMREDIKVEFSKLTDPKRYDDLQLETDEYLNWHDFKDAIKQFLTSNLDLNMEETEIIMEYTFKFKQNNGT